MAFQQVYGGRHRKPGISSTVETFENEFLWGTYPSQQISGLAIDGSTRDTGNTGYTHILRPGILLGQNSSTKKLFVWNPSAIDGTEYIWGVLAGNGLSMLSNNANTDRFDGLIVVGGGLLSNRLIIPGTTAVGIVGNALEYVARQQLRANFMLNDSYMFGRPDWTIHTVSAAEQSAGITLLHSDSHREYHNSGGTLTATLPATPYKGVRYRFYAQTPTTDEITVASGSSNILVPGDLSSASSLSVDGDFLELEGDGSNWVVLEL